VCFTFVCSLCLLPPFFCYFRLRLLLHMRFRLSISRARNSSMPMEIKYSSKVTNSTPLKDSTGELTLACLGIAYQRAPFDPFLNGTQCLLDANLMKTLGVNVIRSTSPFSPNGMLAEVNLQRTTWIPLEIMMIVCKHSRKMGFTCFLMWTLLLHKYMRAIQCGMPLCSPTSHR
jgi:hypothetical protein